MSLSAMIRKRQPGKFATATVATFATVQPKLKPSVATVASVAVANPETPQTDTDKPCSYWLFHFIDRDDLPVLFVPPATHAEALAYYPDAVAAEPIARVSNATNEAANDEGDKILDERRTCTQCQFLRGRVCSVAKPGGLVSANRGYQPNPETLQRCAGYLPNDTDPDQRYGHERWPGISDGSLSRAEAERLAAESLRVINKERKQHDSKSKETRDGGEVS